MLGDPLPEEESILPTPEKLMEKMSQSYPSITRARVHALTDEDIEAMTKRADQLARQARLLDEHGNEAGAEKLRNEFDELYAELYIKLKDDEINSTTVQEYGDASDESSS